MSLPRTSTARVSAGVRPLGATPALITLLCGFAGSWLPSSPAAAQRPRFGPADRVGQSLAVSDFDGDGRDDLAVVTPDQSVAREEWGAGYDAVHVYYGGTGYAQVWSEATRLRELSPNSREWFGHLVAAADFNADGYGDLAVVTRKTIRVIFGSREGLTTNGNQVFQQADTAFAAAVGHFNDDEYADLAIGLPWVRASSTAGDSGAVRVIYGSPTGLSSTFVAEQTITQASPYINLEREQDDRFGECLAVGDFDRDGRDDLAVAAPGESIEAARVGIVHILFSGTEGLTRSARAHQSISQATLAVPNFLKRRGFGTSLAAGDYNGDGSRDLAIGLPQTSNTLGGATEVLPGQVNVVFGRPNLNLRVSGSQVVGWSSTGLPAADERGGLLGHSIWSGNFDGDQADDLILAVLKAGRIGVLTVLPGSQNGVSTTRRQLWSSDSPGIDPYTEREATDFGNSSRNERFGVRVVAADFDGDGLKDLAVSATDKRDRQFERSGTFTTIYGRRSAPSSAPSLSAERSETIHFRVCTVAGQLGDCLDADGDGLLGGVERLARSSDQDPDSDDDGIPDNVEVRPEPTLEGNVYRADLRSNPSVPTAYVVLLHAEPTNGFVPETLRSRLQALQPASGLEFKVWAKQVTASQAGTLNASCDQTFQSQDNAPASQFGWLSPTQLQTYVGAVNQSDALTVVAPYAHVGRICVATTDATAALHGAVQYKGGWQFMVRMRALPETRTEAQRDLWNRALVSLTAHELGHSLGLGHGGDSDDDCSPLYPSVMNHAYDYQVDAASTCSQIGFSPGLLVAPPPAKQLEIKVGTSEFDILRDVIASGGQPVSPEQLSFLACFGHGDLGGTNDDVALDTVAIEACGPDSGPALSCANWDRDEFSGAEENEEGEYESVDGPYTATSLQQARTGRARLQGFVSGCTVSDLGDPDPNVVLHDSNDFQTIRENLPMTGRRDNCGVDACDAAVREPPTATLLDSLRGLWPSN